MIFCVHFGKDDQQQPSEINEFIEIINSALIVRKRQVMRMIFIASIRHARKRRNWNNVIYGCFKSRSLNYCTAFTLRIHGLHWQCRFFPSESILRCTTKSPQMWPLLQHFAVCTRIEHFSCILQNLRYLPPCTRWNAICGEIVLQSPKFFCVQYVKIGAIKGAEVKSLNRAGRHGRGWASGTAQPRQSERASGEMRERVKIIYAVGVIHYWWYVD